MAHAQLEYIIKMVLKTLVGKEVDEVFALLGGKNTGVVRERVLKAASQSLGEGDEAYRQLAGMIDAAATIAVERNAIIHWPFARAKAGHWGVLNNEAILQPPPSVLNSTTSPAASSICERVSIIRGCTG